MKFRLGRVLLRPLFALVLLGPVAAAADEVDRPLLQAQKEQLLKQMLDDPKNLDVAFAYADVAARLGDNEGAVSALEQMLLFNPNLPRVDLELGALYFRMGSFDVARSYFDKAAAANPPPEVTARIDQYKALIEREQLPTRVSGSLFFGAQYQSDANVAPANAMVNSPVGPVLLNNQFVKTGDVDMFLSGSILYSYDLGDQNRDTVEVAGNGLVNHYLTVSRLDLDYGEVTAGPRFRFPELPEAVVRSATLKPYAIVNEVGLGGQQYFYTYGAGLEATGTVWDDIAVKAAVEFREKRFTDAADRPLSSGLTGNDVVVSLAVTKPVTTNSAVSLEFDYVDQSTRLAYYGNQSYAIAAAYHIRYDEPLGFPMETTFFGSRLWSIYGAPDPCCNTGGGPFFSPSSRDDRRWRFGIAQGFQVADRVMIMVQLQRDIVSSNLSLYGYTSNSVVIGPQIRF